MLSRESSAIYDFKKRRTNTRGQQATGVADTPEALPY